MAEKEVSVSNKKERGQREHDTDSELLIIHLEINDGIE